jgi:hypothetical protein
MSQSINPTDPQQVATELAQSIGADLRAAGLVRQEGGK